MNKIVILQESRIERQKQAIKDFDEELNKHSFLQKARKISEILKLIKDDSCEIKTIIAHSSDIKKEHKKEKQIKDYCKNNGTDLVYFTGNQNQKWIKLNSIPTASLSARQLYSENLVLFLKNFNNNYNLGYLIFGENHQLNQLLNFRMYLNIYISKGNDMNQIYDKLDEKVDIDSILINLNYNSSKENFLNIDLNDLLQDVTKAINDYVIYGVPIE